MRVYPAPGLLCRDPVKKDLLPESGRDVSDNDLFWQRRLADGDVVTTPPKSTSAVTSATFRSNDE
ncbi:hypothetical protein B0E46_15840 [Rhodanobacter sp. B04]|uniref:DUF2635 domain-containing protein n=1 Tax=Rhodanobacter sp. B04 TaxID=1945860 RepID=UPI000986450E|nr:DUF2635 domain-containing protein [Rhodanobacter sp. B04]OOG61447.1 hypothetical protein B0E46_15840 [Rhodanobacter sp. B04]